MPPRWLTAALALWTVLVAVALANATPVPVSGWGVAAVIGLLCLAHGTVHHRWRIAGPLAVLAALLAAGGVLGFLPMGTSAGPALALTPRAAWTAVAIVAGVDIAVALLLHLRIRRRAALAGEELSQVTARCTDADNVLRSNVGDLARRVTAVEGLLTRTS